MLVLSRKLKESIVIGPVGPGGETVRIDLLRIDGGQVRLGIEAPRSVPVFRAELVQDEPRKAKSVFTSVAEVLRELFLANQTVSKTQCELSKRQRRANRWRMYHAGYNVALRHLAESLGITAAVWPPAKTEGRADG